MCCFSKLDKRNHRWNKRTQKHTSISGTSCRGQTPTLFALWWLPFPLTSHYLFSTMSNTAVITIVNLVSLRGHIIKSGLATDGPRCLLHVINIQTMWRAYRQNTCVCVCIVCVCGRAWRCVLVCECMRGISLRKFSQSGPFIGLANHPQQQTGCQEMILK